MKLFYTSGACSRAPHIMLNEMGIKFQSERLDPKNKVVSEGDYLTKINPKGHIPALKLDDGQVLTEVGTLIQFIADQKPEMNMIPKFGTFERYRAMEWINFIATDLHKGFSPLFNPQLPEEMRKMMTTNIEKKLSFVADTLSKQPYLMGSQFTAPDAYLFTVLGWSKRVQVDLTKWPVIMGFIERMEQRPAVQTTIKAEQ